ncbi:glutaredoxin 3 [Pseudooceanicola sp.]|uniref:glutaredoxin 3 n=1 Tax=Pseudooceanicola sp. TaxID=1914328 RepID=UPI0035C7627F
MQPVVIYTTPICGFCHAAKRLLDGKGVAYEEIDVMRSAEKKQEMMEKSGRRTVPQIWVGATHVGGCDELYELERAGKLDPMLAG